MAQIRVSNVDIYRVSITIRSSLVDLIDGGGTIHPLWFVFLTLAIYSHLYIYSLDSETMNSLTPQEKAFRIEYALWKPDILKPSTVSENTKSRNGGYNSTNININSNNNNNNNQNTNKNKDNEKQITVTTTTKASKTKHFTEVRWNPACAR